MAAKNEKLERVTVLIPGELIARIDAYRFGEPCDLAAIVANSDRKSERVTLMLPREMIELIDAFRRAFGLRTRREAFIRVLADGLDVQGSSKAKLNS